ncbi:MAG: hypothetical protein YYHSYBAR_002617 [Candidatus Fervidibacter sacchari]
MTSCIFPPRGTKLVAAELIEMLYASKFLDILVAIVALGLGWAVQGLTRSDPVLWSIALDTSGKIIVGDEYDYVE